MKKIITIAVLIGIASLAASPFIIGSKIESVMQEQAQLSDQKLKRTVKSNPYLGSASFKLETYEKSFLKASAHSLLHIETVIPTDDGEPLIINLPIISEITHGPYLGDSGFGLAKIVSRLDIAKMELPEAITPDTVTVEDIISFSGQLDETMTILPVKLDNSEGTIFDFAGATANVQTTSNNRLTFTGDIIIKDVKIENTERSEAFHLQPITVDIQGTGDSGSDTGKYQLQTSEIKGKGSSGISISAEKLSAHGTYKPAENIDLVLGQQEMTLANIEFNDPALSPEPIKLPKFTTKSLTEEGDKETINAAATYSAVFDPSLMVLLQSPVDIKTAQVDIKFSAIPASALQVYMEMAQNLEPSKQAETGMAKVEEQLPELIQNMINHATAMFISVKADTEEGGLVAEVDINLQSDAEFTEFSKEKAAALMAQAEIDPAAFLTVLSGKGHLHLDKSVTDNAGLTPLVQMMAADFTTLEEEAFKSELLIKAGQIWVNGRPLPLFNAEPKRDEVLEESMTAEEPTTEEPTLQE